MRRSRPPVVATWLLEHIRPGNENDESLTGDLMEEYGQGRGGAWYWRQVLTAIVVFFWADIRTHKLLAIKATVTGWLASFLFQAVALRILVRFHLWLPLYEELPWFLGKDAAAALAWVPLWVPAWVGSGWFMSRLYRLHLAMTVLVFSTSVLIWNLLKLPSTVNLLLRVAGEPRFPFRLVAALITLTLPSICILLGGLIAFSSKCELFPEGS